MGCSIEHNCLLVLPDDQLSKINLREGEVFSSVKDGLRIYPINIAIEFCDKDYRYFGKVTVTKLSLEKDQTTLECRILKIFSADEAKVYLDNFIPVNRV